MTTESQLQRKASASEMSEWKSIYLRNNDVVSSLYHQQKSNQIKHQKIWVIVNIILLLSISSISIALLFTKARLLHEFYSDSVCCYCLWAGQNISDDNHEIEYSACSDHKGAINYQNEAQKICYFNDAMHCGIENSFRSGHYSTTSALLFWNFHKYYPYYGIFNISLVVVYGLYLVIATFWYKNQLSFLLLIGNILISINAIYAYIKLHQYVKYDYHETCPSQEMPIDNTLCYRDILPPTLEAIMNYIFLFLTLFIMPFYLCVCARCRPCCKRRMHLTLVWIFIIGGMIILIISFIMLCMVINHGDAELIKFFSAKQEKAFMMFIAVILLIISIDAVFLKHFREQMWLMLSMLCSDSAVKKSYYVLNSLESASDRN